MSTVIDTIGGDIRARAADGTTRRTIAYFGFDRADAAVARRAAAFVADGSQVIGFMFHRLRGLKPLDLPFPVVDLGTTTDLNYLRRLPRLALGLLRIWRNRRQLHRCRIIFARNLDMLALAVLARSLTTAKAVLVYEVLDVRPAFLGTGLLARTLRVIERRLISRSDLIVVSSPAFIEHYFRPMQGYEGPWHLLENKLHPSQIGTGLALARSAPRPGAPWVIGWFGVLRCRRSLDILARIARQLGSRVRVVMRGITSESDVPRQAIEAVCRELANVTFEGPFVSPRDLGKIYGEVHLVWTVDFQNAGGNSDWLLPNRLYDGGYHGAVALAAVGTATGDMIERECLGWALAEPLEETAPRFLEQLEPEPFLSLRRSIEARDRSLFVDLHDTTAMLARIDRMVEERFEVRQLAGANR